MAKKVTETKEQKKARDSTTKVVEPKKLKIKVALETKGKSEKKSPATKEKVTDLTIEKSGSKVSVKSKTIAKSPA